MKEAVDPVPMAYEGLTVAGPALRFHEKMSPPAEAAKPRVPVESEVRQDKASPASEKAKEVTADTEPTGRRGPVGAAEEEGLPVEAVTDRKQRRRERAKRMGKVIAGGSQGMDVRVRDGCDQCCKCWRVEE